MVRKKDSSDDKRLTMRTAGAQAKNKPPLSSNAKRGAHSTGSTDGPGELRIDLHGAGMTSLNKVGLAGLYMTLKAFERRPSITSVNGKQSALERLRSVAKCRTSKPPWELGPTAVTFRWEADPRSFFGALFEESFRVYDRQLVWFPALGLPTEFTGAACVLQDALLNTILQFGPTRKADPALAPEGKLSVEIHEQTHVMRFRRIQSYPHQNPDKDFEPSKHTALTGWLFPGGTERHSGATGTKLEVSPPLALALRYLAVGAIYFEIKRRVAKNTIRPRYALVIPDVGDLDQYASVRRRMLKAGIKQLVASGTSEAGLRVLAELDAAGLLRELRSASCRVVSFGIVPWSTKQKTRVEVFDVRAETEQLAIYRLCQTHLEPRFIEREGKVPFWDVPQVPDLVAANLIAGRPWWIGFANFIADKECCTHVLAWERKGLAAMVNDTLGANDDESAEHAFVTACHEAWHRRLGQLGDKARRQGSRFRDLADREFERLRVQFARAKNAATIRAALVDFWSRAGSALPELRERWPAVLSLLDDKNWQKARDLALLAMASYQPRSKQEETALTSESPETADLDSDLS